MQMGTLLVQLAYEILGSIFNLLRYLSINILALNHLLKQSITMAA
jgi:hypothetical protein